MSQLHSKKNAILATIDEESDYFFLKKVLKSIPHHGRDNRILGQVVIQMTNFCLVVSFVFSNVLPLVEKVLPIY